MGIFSQITRAVESILPKLFGDTDLAVDITWKLFESAIFDPDAQVNVETYAESTIAAIRIKKDVGSMRSRQIPPGPWNMAVGDVVFLFQSDNVPSGASIKDLIVDAGYTYGVEKITPIFGLITQVEVRGYA